MSPSTGRSTPLTPNPTPPERRVERGERFSPRRLYSGGEGPGVRGSSVPCVRYVAKHRTLNPPHPQPHTPRAPGGEGRKVLPSPPVLRGRGAGGEGVECPLRAICRQAQDAQPPSPPTPHPQSAGWRGEKGSPLAACTQGERGRG